MKYIGFALLLILSLFTLSCNGEQEKYNWEQLELSLETVTLLSDSTQQDSTVYFSHPRYVVTDSEGRIIVADLGRNELLAFNENGNFLYTIGKRGPGPAEFRQIAGMSINEADEILVFDRASQSIKKFSTTGEYITSHVFKNNVSANIEFEKWNGIPLLFYLQYKPNADTNKVLHVYSQEFNLKEDYIPLQELKNVNNNFLSILSAINYGSHFVTGDYLYFTPAIYNGLIYKYKITKNGKGQINIVLKDKYQGLTHMKPAERFLNEDLSYADAKLSLSRGRNYQFLVHNQSKGLFRLNNEKIVHYTYIEQKNPHKRTFGIELYDQEMNPIGYAPIKDITYRSDQSANNRLQWNVIWKDNKDRFYIIDTDSQGPPSIRIVKLKGISTI